MNGGNQKQGNSQRKCQYLVLDVIINIVIIMTVLLPPMSQSGNYEAMFGVCYVIRYSLPNAQSEGHTYAEDRIYKSIPLQNIISVVSKCMLFS